MLSIHPAFHLLRTQSRESFFVCVYWSRALNRLRMGASVMVEVEGLCSPLVITINLRDEVLVERGGRVERRRITWTMENVGQRGGRTARR